MFAVRTMRELGETIWRGVGITPPRTDIRRGVKSFDLWRNFIPGRLLGKKNLAATDSQSFIQSRSKPLLNGAYRAEVDLSLQGKG